MTFDASSAEPERPLKDLLGDLEQQDAVRALERSLDAVEDLVARWDERDAGQPLDPDIVADLAAAVGRKDAPAEYQSIRRRVAEGRLTWEEYWHDPSQIPGGMRLLHETIRLNAARLNDIRQQFAGRQVDLRSSEFRDQLRQAETRHAEEQRSRGKNEPGSR